MSLIDEALKRARGQAAPDPAVTPAAQPRPPIDPWAYAPLPHARRRSRAWRWGIASVVFAAALAGAAAMWMSRSGGNAASRPKTTARAAAPAVTAPSLPEASAVPRKTGDAAPSTRPSPGVATPQKPRSERMAPVSVPARPAAVAPESPPKPETPPEPASRPVARVARAVDGRTYVGALVSPSGARIELGGIVYSDTNPSALLNGRVLPVGGVVEGLTISAIEADRVELSAEGLTVHLTLR